MPASKRPCRPSGSPAGRPSAHGTAACRPSSRTARYARAECSRTEAGVGTTRTAPSGGGALCPSRWRRGLHPSRHGRLPLPHAARPALRAHGPRRSATTGDARTAVTSQLPGLDRPTPRRGLVSPRLASPSTGWLRGRANRAWRRPPRRGGRHPPTLFARPLTPDLLAARRPIRRRTCVGPLCRRRRVSGLDLSSGGACRALRRSRRGRTRG